MSQDWYADVLDWNVGVKGINFQPVPHTLTQEEKARVVKLINEEVNDELIPAIESSNLLESVDGAVDSIVVILGAMVYMGVDIRPIWDEVHRTNMLKVGGKKRADGKLLKPEGWKPPEVQKLIQQQIQSYNAF
jgi:predicted HAD superfamily Cof-like phosphohydrolase